MKFTVEPFVLIRELNDFQEYVHRALTQIAEALEAIEDVQLPVLHVEPAKRNEGQLALADGTDWDPGSGAGVYRWDGAAWQFLG